MIVISNLAYFRTSASSLCPGQASSGSPAFHLKPLILYRDHLRVPLADLSAPLEGFGSHKPFSIPLSSRFGGSYAGTVLGCGTRRPKLDRKVQSKAKQEPYLVSLPWRLFCPSNKACC